MVAQRADETREEYNARSSEIMKQRHIEHRMWALKFLGSRCLHCGTTKDLEFDHIDPKKKSYHIGRMAGHYSKEKLEVELLKCQLLCKPCHQRKTGIAKHGARSRYVGGCRCKPCTNSNRIYALKLWRARKK